MTLFLATSGSDTSALRLGFATVVVIIHAVCVFIAHVVCSVPLTQNNVTMRKLT